MVVRPTIDQQVTFFCTSDLAATASFYEQKLGLSLALDQGNCLIYRVGRDAFLGFCHSQETPALPTSIIFTIVTDQVDEWYGYLTQQGIEFEKPPTYNPIYNIYHCFLRDPNGYLIEIQRFLDPAWPKFDPDN